jgi:NAD(P)-dependent dehydrogenase (short-subunit alcohol dehydrogenase family)
VADGRAAGAGASGAQSDSPRPRDTRPRDTRPHDTRPHYSRPAVLITGASKGIGEACAYRLARDGFRVYAGVRSEEDGAALVRSGGDNIVPVLLDITDAAQIVAAAERISRETGARGLQALVNNAGIAIAGPLEFLPLDELRRQLEVNVVAQIAVTQACLPLLRRSRDGADPDHRAGRIIFMSSVSGRSALPFIGPYAASKHALEAAADALRVELRPFGLRVVLVEPGVIATPIWETALAAGEANLQRMPAEVFTYYGAAIATMKRRIGSIRGLAPERVADVVSQALTARRPRTRYLLGRGARLRLLLEWALPTGLRDWAIGRGIRS